MDGQSPGNEGTPSAASEEKQKADGQWELLRKSFWLGMIGLTLISLIGLLMVRTGAMDGRSLFGWLKWIDLQIKDNGHQGAPALFFVIIVLFGFVLMLVTTGNNQQSLRNILGPLVVGVSLMGLGGYLLPAQTLWGWALATLPAMLVVHHALYLGFIKPRFIGKLREGADQGSRDIELSRYEEDEYFKPEHIALRYGLPALAIFGVASIVFHCLNPVTDWALNETLKAPPDTILNTVLSALFASAPQTKEWITYPTLEAARFGAVGAYIYVLLYLGQRGFQHDLSSGSVLWCAVTLALGPLMAAAFSKIWLTGVGGTASQGWATQALYIAVGMTPRYTAQQISLLAQRLGSQGAQASAAERALPLSLIRGITPRVAERLIEEGIDDVAALAMANPVRIQRSTNFDKRQVLAWIDSALLVYALPDTWMKLEELGIRCATDLVWCEEHELKAPDGQPANSQSPLGNLDLKVIRRVAQRLREDGQVRFIQMLYQFVDKADSHQAGGTPGDAGTASPLRKAA